ncbi:MAG TPA: ATP-binding protein, partial [Candidatus Thermoplasmatota archaeon]|nr:ATP-binding protein [Candidatus Thermoplasmatota archaeon]
MRVSFRAASIVAVIVVLSPLVAAITYEAYHLPDWSEAYAEAQVAKESAIALELSKSTFQGVLKRLSAKVDLVRYEVQTARVVGDKPLAELAPTAVAAAAQDGEGVTLWLFASSGTLLDAAGPDQDDAAILEALRAAAFAPEPPSGVVGLGEPGAGASVGIAIAFTHPATGEVLHAAGTIEAEAFARLVFGRSWLRPSSGDEVYLLDRDGRIVGWNNLSSAMKAPRRASFDYLAPVRAGSALQTTAVVPEGHGRWAEGQRILVVALPTERNGWIIVVETSLDEILAPATELRQTLLYLTGITTVAALLFAVVLTGYASRGLRDLSGRVERIGRGHLSDRIPASGVAELRDLSTTVNQMAADLQARERELVQAEKMSAMGTLVAGVAHEINNPLAFMKGNLQLNREVLQAELSRPDLPPHTREALEAALVGDAAVLDGVERISHITKSLKAVARATAREFAPEDVNEIVENVLTVAAPRLKDRFVVERDFQARAKARANSGELSQVLLNLVLNAADAMAPLGTGTLRVRTYDDRDHVVVEVQDTGPGIRPEDEHRIFTPFFTTKAQGTGLGLSVSYRIVEDHGGKLTFRSTLGAGTVFR